MSVKTFETYTLICDEPGCEADFVEELSDGDYSGFASLDNIDLADRDWVKRGEQHFCGEHASSREPSDVDTVEEERAADPTPLPPAIFDLPGGAPS